MSSRRQHLTGRTCQKIGHSFPIDLLVCRRCHRDLPSIKRGDSKVFRVVRPKRGPWSIRRFLERRVPRGASQNSMCHDCAFRPGSPERRDVFGAWLSVLEGVSRHVPFFCHQTMPVDARGSYCPKQNEHGHAIGHPLCAGWLIEHRQYHRPGHGLHSKFVRPTAAEIDGEA